MLVKVDVPLFSQTTLIDEVFELSFHVDRDAGTSLHVCSVEVAHALEHRVSFGGVANCLLGHFLLGQISTIVATKTLDGK